MISNILFLIVLRRNPHSIWSHVFLNNSQYRTINSSFHSCHKILSLVTMISLKMLLNELLNIMFSILIFLGNVVVQPFSPVQLIVTPWTVVHQASLSFTISQSLLKFMPVESVMLSNHLILWGPILFFPSIFPSIRVFSFESALHIRWPKYWSFSFNFSPSN